MDKRCECIKETSKAILVQRTDSQVMWIPKTIIANKSEVKKLEDFGLVKILNVNDIKLKWEEESKNKIKRIDKEINKKEKTGWYEPVIESCAWCDRTINQYRLKVYKEKPKKIKLNYHDCNCKESKEGLEDDE